MGAPKEERCRMWTTRLEDDTVAPIAAHDLYCGDHWAVAKGLAAGAQSRRVELWVASAGYGLVPASAPLKPYAATFTPGIRIRSSQSLGHANLRWLLGGGPLSVCGPARARVVRGRSPNWRRRRPERR